VWHLAWGDAFCTAGITLMNTRVRQVRLTASVPGAQGLEMACMRATCAGFHALLPGQALDE